MPPKKFDLNIEKILNNVIDEQILTKTKNIRIFKDSKGRRHIRDYGRDLRDEKT